MINFTHNMLSFFKDAIHNYKSTKKILQILQTTFKSITCNGFTIPENFFFQNAKNKNKNASFVQNHNKVCSH